MRRGGAGLRTLLVLMVVAVGAAIAATWWWRAARAPSVPRADATPAVGAPRIDVPDTERAPEGVRIRVQVLNATRTRGLARRATFMLRDRGFDVVETGTASVQRDSTLVVHHGGSPDWAARVARAMGGARVETRPDTSRYLDVSVLIGATWRPPAEPFYP